MIYPQYVPLIVCDQLERKELTERLYLQGVHLARVVSPGDALSGIGTTLIICTAEAKKFIEANKQARDWWQNVVVLKLIPNGGYINKPYIE